MEAQYHINYLEMLAIYLALQNFAKGWANTHIRVMCDNTTAVNVINHMGTSHSDSCNSLAKEIWEWCIARDIWVSVAHIPGKQNLVTDFESRRNQREAEWRLNKAALQNALSRLNFRPDIDLFASRINYLFPKYVSYRPDPEAFAIDAFSLQWSKLDFYTFPPFNVIPAVLSKIQREEALGVVVFPDWPAQGWYPKALEMLKQEPIYLKARRGPTPVTKSSRGSTPSLAQTEPPSLSLIRESLGKYNLSSSAKDVLMASWREGTSKQYHAYLKRWRQYCDDKDIDLFQPGVHNGVEFFVSLYKAGLGYSAVNTARSALSSLLI